MASTSYPNTKAYHKQGGDEVVIADGGLITVESGGGIDLESGGGVDIESGATIGVESGGKISLESGGEIEAASGGFFDLKAGADVYFTASTYKLSAAQMGALLVPQVAITTIIQSQGVGSLVLSTINLPSSGYIFFSDLSMSAASAWLCTTAGIPGQLLYLAIRGDDASVCSIMISMSGVGVIGTLSGDLSSFILNGSTSSQPWVRLLLTGAQEWSILDRSAIGVVEQPAA